MSKRKVVPISPDDVVETKKVLFPDEVIEAFNECIAKHFSAGRSSFSQQEVAGLISQKMKLEYHEFDKIFKNHWLDVEEIYEAQGWKVGYDKPGYNESYEPVFEFVRKKK